MPVLVGAAGVDVARGGGVQLDRRAEDGAHAHHDGRVVQQERELFVLPAAACEPLREKTQRVRHLLEHVVDEVVLGVRRLLAAAAAPVALGALEHTVERGAQLLHLRRRQRVVDLQPRASELESAASCGGARDVERTSRKPHCWKNATSAASASSTTGTG